MTSAPTRRTDKPRYAELHAHTAYSFLDGASQPEDLVAEAARLGLEALAVTDHDGLYGVVKFSQAAKVVGLPTAFGAELHLPAPDGRRHPRELRRATPGLPILDPPTAVPDPRATHLLVLARGPDGYRALSSTIARAHLRTREKGAADYRLEELAEAAAGNWLVLTGCRKGTVRRALSGGDPSGTTGVAPGGFEAARVELDRLTALFGRDNVAVEVTAAGDAYDAERADALAALAEAVGLPLVATGNVHYATPADADLAAALAAVRARSSLDDMDGWLPGAPVAHLRSAAEMLALHRRHPQAVTAAAELAAECAFDLRLVAPRLPPFPVPPGHDEASYLRELVYRGAAERYGPPEAEREPGAYARLENELRVIEELGFPGYFLVVYDLVRFCRERGILAQGRGSAANSAVCYALQVTAVDAVHHKLLFERFLAPERDGPPDIDVDVESRRREEVIQYVYDKHGREHAAQVANVISYRPRSAVRDAARAFGYDVGQQDAWSTSVERWGSLRGPRIPSEWWTVYRSKPAAPEPSEVVADGHDVVPTFRPPPVEEESDVPDAVIDLAERMLRLPRHLGIHPGGMVMCDRPVIEVCPVEWARMPGRTVLQWDKDDCADAGLVKFDLLGLGMLTALSLMFGQVADHEGERLTLHGLPQDDPRVYELLARADTVGVFQVESRAQMGTLPRLKPEKFKDIVIEVALIRPGPIQGGSVHPYIERAKERQKVEYLHPLLEPALKRTLGVPLFQEQLMQMAVDAAGFTPAEADQLRRAMGAKRSRDKMEALHARLLEGMARNGIDKEKGEQIFAKLEAFADFGFPESHAYSFAYLVYASAWLKVYHSAAFYAGVIAAQPMGFYSPQTLAADARRHGVGVLRPDVQASGVQAVVERTGPTPPGGEPPLVPRPSGTGPVPGPGVRAPSTRSLAVRLGLAPVRSVGEETATRLVTEREANGPFADLHDLVRRVDLTAAQLESLATAGALASLGVTRREGLWAAGALSAEGPDTLPGVSVGVTAPTLPGMERVEEATADVWASGVSADSYPTQFVRDGLDAAGVLRVMEVYASPLPEGRVAVAGVVTHRQRPGTAQGVTFLSLEDETGLLNVICSAGLWQRFRRTARTSKALVVRGRLERGDDATNLVAEHLAPLSLRVRTTSRDFR